MSVTTAHRSPYTFPRSADDWIYLRDFLMTGIVVTKSHKQWVATWAVVSLLGLTAVLCIVAVTRALYLKKYYIVMRDSFGRLCPHWCILVSFFDLIYISFFGLNLSLQLRYPNDPFLASRLVLDHSAVFCLACLGGVWTWGVWCSMPPPLVRAPNSKMSWWRIHGACLLLINLTGEFITSILTVIPMVRHLARVQKIWAISRPRLDAIVRHAVSQTGITPSPNNFRFESNTLLILLDLKKHSDLFLLNLRRFASGFFSFTLLTAFMFFYASITILLALNTQLKLIDEVLRKASRARSPTSQQIDPSYTSQSMLKRAQTKVFEFRKLLTWKAFFDFLRKEELDYTFDTASIDQHCLIEHESKLLKKASRLRRHWWRIFLQSIIVAALTMSYCTLAFTLAANVWGLGDEHFVTQIEYIVDAWKIWTWVSGPGIMLAAITCVSEFLGEAKDEPEPCVVKPKSKERSPEGSFIPNSTRESSFTEGVNRLFLGNRPS